MYDGHGSTRQTVDNSEAVTDAFSYDAYGVLLGNPATTTTNLLYTGEMYDSQSDSYYLRARYYFPSTGTFNRSDPFQGNNQDPQSLHKYLYCHANPINGVDPSGLSWFFARLGKAVHRQIQLMYEMERIGDISFGTGIPGAAGVLKPDIMDFTLKEIGEIKPFSVWGVSTGPIQLATYIAAANKLLGGGWSYSKWDIGVRQVSVPEYPDYFVVTLGNAYGLIFYRAVKMPELPMGITLTAASLAFLKKLLDDAVEQVRELARTGGNALPGLVYALDQSIETSVNTAVARNTICIAAGAIGVYIIAQLLLRTALLPATRF